MIYKLIILTASLLFMWEFMKVRSTAVAQIEPNLTAQAQKLSEKYTSVIGVTGEPVYFLKEDLGSIKYGEGGGCAKCCAGEDSKFCRTARCDCNTMAQPYIAKSGRRQTAANAWMQLHGV